MHGRLCPKPEENGAVDSLEMPVPTASGGRTRRTGLLTVMERPPGKKKHYTGYFIRFILFYALQSPPCMQNTPFLPHIHIQHH